MPGLIALLDLPSADERASGIKTMLQTMQHEPFYLSGHAEHGELASAVAWVAHPGSYAACLPIWNERKDVCLYFTGEHYSDRRDVARLQAAGHAFDPENASALVHLYEELGLDFLQELNGTFAGIIVDLRDRCVHIFNDRFGLCRLYVHEAAGTLFVASEAKAILRIRPALRTFDPRSLGDFLVANCTMQHRSFFPGISILPPASVWTLRRGAPLHKSTYFSPDQWEAQAPLDREAYFEELKATLQRVIPAYFRGPETIGLSLTGGLDSRMILAATHGRIPHLPCYTFGGTYRECEDVRIARRIAALCGRPHNVITVDSSFFSQFLDNAARCVYITDGAMDVTGSVGLFVNRQARAFGTVRVTGNYGSEVLRRNVVLRARRPATPFLAPAFRPVLADAITSYQEDRAPISNLSFILTRQVPWHHYCRFSEEYSQLQIRSPFLDNEIARLAYRASSDLYENKHLAYRFTTATVPALQGAPTDRGFYDRPRFVPPSVFRLWKELRPKAEYYFDYGMTHGLAKVDRAFSFLRLERLFLGQQKYYHFRIWYRRPLAESIRQVLLDDRTLARPFVEPRAVRHMVEAHTRGTENHTLAIHKLLTLELLHRKLIDAA